MTKRDFDRAVGQWLDEGSDATPPEVIDAVLLAVRHTPQERHLRVPWRTVPMTPLRVAAAVVIMVAGGLAAFSAFGRGPNVGAGPTPSVASLPPGPHVMVSTVGLNEDRVAVTIPAPGWFAAPDQASLSKDLGNDDRVTVVTVPGDHYQVPANICRWRAESDLVPSNDASTRAHELLAYLMEQTYDAPGGPLARDLGTPTDITIDGDHGRSVTGSMPGTDPGDCDEQQFCSLLDRDGDRCLLPHVEANALVTLWVVDHRHQNPSPWVVAATYWPTTSSELLAEMNAIVDSMKPAP